MYHVTKFLNNMISDGRTTAIVQIHCCSPVVGHLEYIQFYLIIYTYTLSWGGITYHVKGSFYFTNLFILYF